MITIYKSTDSTSSVQQFRVPRYSRAYEVANLALPIIRKKGSERGRITRPQLLHHFKEQYGTRRYTATEFSYVWTFASEALKQQGLVAITEETLSQYLTGGGLTEQQIYNYGQWLSYTRIFEKHTKKNQGLYSQEEEDVWGKVGDYMDNEMPAVEAFKTAVGEVLGQEKAAQFYVGCKEKSLSQSREHRRKKRVELLQEDPSRARTVSNYDRLMEFYDGEKSKTRSVILDKLVQDYSTQYPKAMEQYPFGLYFALSKKEPKVVLREKLDSLMQSTPTQPKFDDYESNMFGSLSKSLKPISVRLVQYFDRGFEESEEQIRTLEEQIEGLVGLEKLRTISRVGGMRRGLEIVNARYKDRGTLRTLEEVGRDYEVKRQRIKQLEDRGLALLLEQPTIQELLSLDFWEI